MYLVPKDVIHTWQAEQREREKAADKPIDTVVSQIDSIISQILTHGHV